MFCCIGDSILWRKPQPCQAEEKTVSPKKYNQGLNSDIRPLALLNIRFPLCQRIVLHSTPVKSLERQCCFLLAIVSKGTTDICFSQLPELSTYPSMSAVCLSVYYFPACHYISFKFNIKPFLSPLVICNCKILLY